jgi:hypothetical protein
MRRLLFLALLLALSLTGLHAQGDPGSSFIQWTPIQCYQYYVIFTGSTGYANCYESGLNNNYIQLGVQGFAMTINCPFSTVLTAISYGSPTELFAEGENFGGPQNLDAAQWIYPDGDGITIGETAVLYC